MSFLDVSSIGWNPSGPFTAQFLREPGAPSGGNSPPPWYGDFHMSPDDGEPPRRDFRRWIIGITGVLLVSSLWWYPRVSYLISAQHLTAPVGKRLVVRLKDGSRFVLKPDSELLIWHDRQRLRLELRRGDVLCDLRPNPFRQLELYVRDTRIEDLGTVFLVTKTETAVDVTVKEGTVRLSGPHLPQISLAQNQSSRIDGRTQHTAVDNISPEELKRRLLWLDGHLKFTEETLASVAHEINRYNVHSKIEVTDPTIADRRFTGRVNDPTEVDKFTQLLSTLAPVKVIMSGTPNGTLTYKLQRAD